MELNFKIIKQLGAQEILEFYLPTINSIYSHFDFVDLSKEEYYRLVLEEIIDIKSLSGITTTQPYCDYLKTRIYAIFNKRIVMLLEDYTSQIKLICNYIDQKLGEAENFNDALDSFDKLDAFLENITLTLTLIYYL